MGFHNFECDIYVKHYLNVLILIYSLAANVYLLCLRLDNMLFQFFPTMSSLNIEKMCFHPKAKIFTLQPSGCHIVITPQKYRRQTQTFVGKCTVETQAETGDHCCSSR